MTRPDAWVAALLTLLTLSPAAHAQDEVVADGSSPWHADLEIAYGQAQIGFVGAADVAPVCPGERCGPAGYTLGVVRLAVAVGHAGFHLEGGLTAPPSGSATGWAVWHGGLRIDTAWDAVLSVTLRAGYVRRVGASAGEGGRGGVGINLRPVAGLTLHAGASADVTSVPSGMNGTFFSWSTFLGGGLRLSFGG